MSREYAIVASNVTIAGASTLLFVNPPASGPAIEIVRAWCGQSFGVTNAMQRIQLVTQVTAFPTLTSFTPKKLKMGDPVSVITGGTAGAAGTCGVNASAEGAGAKTLVMEWTFSVLAGWQWVPTRDETIILPSAFASGLGLYLPEAPATLTDWTAGIVYRELG